MGTAIFLASLISLYPILQNVDANKKIICIQEWEAEAYLKLVLHHPNDDALRIQINDSSHNVQDRLYYRSTNICMNMIWRTRLAESISGEQFKETIDSEIKSEGGIMGIRY